MIELPRHITEWLEKNYPRPRVDPEWLQGCYEWLISQPGADSDSQKFLDDIEAQLLQSNLTDSMLEGTGLPIHINEPDSPPANSRLEGPPVLVEIIAMTEIATSAYQLDQIRVARKERMRTGQTDDGEQEGEADLEVEGEGPMPQYPRGMLRFELSDGATVVKAMEYRSMPDIMLGQTPLGFKMLLKNPVIRRGIAFLEPDTVVLKGYQTPERAASQQYDFARGLRVRMGLPIDTLDAVPVQPQPPTTVRPPLRDISPIPDHPTYPINNDDANIEPRRRKLPSNAAAAVVSTSVSQPPASTASSSTTLVPSNPTVSPYFSNTTLNPTFASTQRTLNVGLTPAQTPSASVREHIIDDDGDSELYDQFDNIDLFERADDSIEVDENVPPIPSTPAAVPTLAAASTSTPGRPFTQPTIPASTSSTLEIQSSNVRSLRPEPSIEFVSMSQRSGRPLVSEDSIEVVSFSGSEPFILSQSQPASHSRVQSESRDIGNQKRDKQPESSNPTTVLQSNTSDSFPKTGADRQESPLIELDPELLCQLDEDEALATAHPDFLRMQKELLAEYSQNRKEAFGLSSSAVRLASSATTESKGKGKEQENRPIVPLPRRSMISQSQPRSSTHSKTSKIGSGDRDGGTKVGLNDDICFASSSSPTQAYPLTQVPLDLGNNNEIRDEIDIPDDEEEDKENVPVMTRHVRRKVSGGGPDPFGRGLFAAEGKSQMGNGVGGSTGGKTKLNGSGEIIDLCDD